MVKLLKIGKIGVKLYILGLCKSDVSIFSGLGKFNKIGDVGGTFLYYRESTSIDVSNNWRKVLTLGWIYDTI